MDLRRLRHLTEVIEHGSLGRAAGRLGISQPALSKSLRLLEQELEVQLLERTTTGVVPTVFGRSLYLHAKATAAEIDHARAEIGQLRGKHQGSVHVGALPSVAAGILAKAVALAGRQHAQFAARIVEKMNFELMPALRRGEFDFIVGLVEDDGVELGIRRQVILRDELAVIARAGHPLAERTEIEAAELAACPWLFPMVGASHRHVLEQFFRSAGVEPPLAKVECTSVQMIKSLALQSDHIGVLPAHAMEIETTHGLLVRLPVRSDLLRRTIAISYREHHPVSPAARAMMRAVETICGGIGSGEGILPVR